MGKYSRCIVRSFVDLVGYEFYRVEQNRGACYLSFYRVAALVSLTNYFVGKTRNVAMHCVANHSSISGQGARITLIHPMVRTSAAACQECRLRKLAVPQRRSRRLAVPRTGPVPQVGNFRNTSGPSVNPQAVFRSAHACQTSVVCMFLPCCTS